MFLCTCKAVRISDAVAAVRTGFDSPEYIKQVFGLDDEECCGRCATHIEAFMARVRLELRRSDGSRVMVAAGR